MPRLQQELRGALTGRDRFLALDVVTVLGLKELLPDLVTHIPEDATGYFVHALNTLMDDSSQPDLLKTYLKVLEKSFSDESVLPRTVALIDSLARTRLDLDQKLLKALFRSSQPEVRSSVLGYVRTRIIAWKKESYFDYLGEGLTDRTYQLRLQALLLLQEVPTSWKKKRNADVQRWLKACLQDESQEVRSLCAQVQKRGAA